jgi:hypothetical protein
MDQKAFGKAIEKGLNKSILEDKKSPPKDPIVEETDKKKGMSFSSLFSSKPEDPVDTIVGIIENIHKKKGVIDRIGSFFTSNPEDPVDTIVGIIENIHKKNSSIKFPDLSNLLKKKEHPVDTIVGIIEEITILYPDVEIDGKFLKPISLVKNKACETEMVYEDSKVHGKGEKNKKKSPEPEKEPEPEPEKEEEGDGSEDDTVNTIVEIIEELVYEPARTPISKEGNIFTSGISSIGSAASAPINAITSAASMPINAITSAASMPINAITSAASTPINAITSAVSAPISAISSVVPTSLTSLVPKKLW